MSIADTPKVLGKSFFSPCALFCPFIFRIRIKTKIFSQMEAWFCLVHKNYTRTEVSNNSRCALNRYSRKRIYNCQKTTLTEPILTTRMLSPRQAEAHTPYPLLPHPPSEALDSLDPQHRGESFCCCSSASPVRNVTHGLAGAGLGSHWMRQAAEEHMRTGKCSVS